ncbi:MAG: helix-turn-helix domain-containing protein [Polaribacter sp.]
MAEQLSKSYNIIVHSYAQNKRRRSLEDLYKIADILDVNISDLLIANKKENN